MNEPAPSLATQFLSATVDAFAANKRLAERAIQQMTDDQLRLALDDNTNSIAVIMKHMAGNLVSRFTDFLTTDGEKSWRNRDDEFVDTIADRGELLDIWERGWDCLFNAINDLTETDLRATVLIRGEPHSVLLALQRSLGHACYHVGQIVQLARIHAGDNWDTLTIPRGGSDEFNRQNWGQSGKSHS